MHTNPLALNTSRLPSELFSDFSKIDALLVSILEGIIRSNLADVRGGGHQHVLFMRKELFNCGRAVAGDGGGQE